MIKVSSVVEELVLTNPFYYEIMTQGLANYSKVAQLMHNGVERETQKPVKHSTIVVSLTRLAKRLERKQCWINLTKQGLLDYSMKTPISEIILDNNEANILKLAQLSKKPKEFFSTTIGEEEINVVCTPFYVREINKALKPKKTLAGLALVSIRFKEKLVQTPGLIYYFSAMMFMKNINIIEVISTYTEINFLISQNDLQKVTQSLSEVFNIEGTS